MISNVGEWLWVWCHLNNIWTVFKAAFSYFNITAFLWNFRDFWIFVFGCKDQNENPEITKNLRSSHQRCSVRKGVLRNFTKFPRKHLCQSLFLIKLQNSRPATLLKKRLWHKCFPVNFVRFLRTPFSQSTYWRLLLDLYFLSSKAEMHLDLFYDKKTFCKKMCS